MQASLLERLIALPKMLSYYIETFFFPKDLAISQNWIVKTIDNNSFTIPFVIDLIFLSVIISFTIYFFLKRKQQLKTLIIFLVWFFVSWGIHWNIIPLDMTVAERWFYFAMVGILGLFGITMSNINIISRKKQVILIVLSIFIITALSVRTVIRNQNWSSPLALYEHDSKISTESYDLENSYANSLLLEKRYKESYPHIQKSIQFAPHYWENWSNLGVYYEGKGQIDESIFSFNTAIKNNNNYYRAYINLANIYFHYKSPVEANSYLVKALKVYPKDPTLLLFAGVTANKLGDKQKAKNMVMKAYMISKDHNLLKVYQEIQQDIKIE
jgi:tetratricopeptide (TPR) repeat protein